MASAIPVRGRLHRIQELFATDRNKIRDDIILAEDPEENIDLTTAIRRSSATLGDYVTLDWQHRAEIQGLIGRILGYAEDPTRARPLNIIMQAEPGSGKSHFIRCLANHARLNDTVRPVTFNMSGMQGIEDLIQPLDAVRNLKVIDKMPVLFLDEFDTEPAHYGLLLPLLWDGELHVGHRDLKTGKVVIILAGSGEGIQKAMTGAKTMQKPEPQSTKLVDLLSRINGGEFSIPDLDEISQNRDRRTDKVCVTAALLRQRYGPKLTMVPWSLLRFVAVTKFRYGVRSITHLVELLPASNEDQRTVSVDRLPIGSVDRLKGSSLAYHVVSDDGPAAIVADWKQFSAHKATVRIAEEPEEEIPF